MKSAEYYAQVAAYTSWTVKYEYRYLNNSPVNEDAIDLY